MKRNMVVVAALVVLAVGSVGMAQDWTATILGGQDMALMRLGYSPEATPRVTVGGEFGWLEGLTAADKQERWLAGFFATYALVQDQEFKILGFGAPISWYVGGRGDIVLGEGTSPDATVGLMTGLLLGSNKVAENKKMAASLGIEAGYALTQKQWQALADMDPESRLLFFGQITWR